MFGSRVRRICGVAMWIYGSRQRRWNVWVAGAILMGVVLLGEPFNGWIIAGTALVVGGVFLVTRRRA